MNPINQSKQSSNQTILTLLHTCCGPCASACVPALKEMGREVTMFFVNSNIDTKEEFEKRLHEAEKLAQVDGVKLVALPYDHAEWIREVAAGYESEPEKGARCARCFRYNLKKTAEYAKRCGFDEFATSLTVSPHKVSAMIFAASEDPRFLKLDFKKKEGFKLSVKRTAELGLYRQSYCGCEFSKWHIHHKIETVSTNLDAREGEHGDVFTADYQTAGRGRLDHQWLSPPKTNLMMSAVLSVGGLAPEQVATFPLVAGLAVVKAVRRFVIPDVASAISLKWPNDVLVSGRKIAGILCERNGDSVIVGIGVNVGQIEFSPEIARSATSLAILSSSNGACPLEVHRVRDAVLRELQAGYRLWRERGFAALYPEIAAVDCLRGQTLSVIQTDSDADPVFGVSGGISSDGSLDVGGHAVYAGEAHVVRA